MPPAPNQPPTGGSGGSTATPIVSDPLHAFLRGEAAGPDNTYTMLDILKWDYERMERVHNYIQWVFPNEDRSQFNMHAPLLTRALAETVAADSQAMANIQNMFVRFLGFAGLEIHQDTDTLWIEKSAAFNKRRRVVWGGQMNHNWLRISRILKCFGMLGMVDQQAALFKALESLWESGDIPSSARKSFSVWADSAGQGSMYSIPPHPDDAAFGSNAAPAGVQVAGLDCNAIIVKFIRDQLQKSKFHAGSLYLSKQQLIDRIRPSTIDNLINFLVTEYGDSSFSKIRDLKMSGNRKKHMCEKISSLDDVTAARYPFQWSDDGPVILAEWIRSPEIEEQRKTLQKLIVSKYNPYGGTWSMVYVPLLNAAYNERGYGLSRENKWDGGSKHAGLLQQYALEKLFGKETWQEWVRELQSKHAPNREVFSDRAYPPASVQEELIGDLGSFISLAIRDFVATRRHFQDHAAEDRPKPAITKQPQRRFKPTAFHQPGAQSTAFMALKYRRGTLVVLSQKKNKQGNYVWMITGGQIDKHKRKRETPLEAAIRETLEESGVDISGKPTSFLNKQKNCTLYACDISDLKRITWEKRTVNPPETREWGVARKDTKGKFYVVDKQGNRHKSQKFRKGTLEHLKLHYDHMHPNPKPVRGGAAAAYGGGRPAHSADADMQQAIELSLQEQAQSDAEFQEALHRSIEDAQQAIQRSFLQKQNTQQKKVRAMFAFTARSDDELSFEKGQVITLLPEEFPDPNWHLGRLDDGRKGLFPANRVERI